jgi:hypothetical protein
VHDPDCETKGHCKATGSVAFMQSMLEGSAKPRETSCTHDASTEKPPRYAVELGFDSRTLRSDADHWGVTLG